MSVRVSTTSLIAASCVVGDRGHGVLGSEVPSTGLHGAGYLYNDITLPGEANDEFRGLIISVPTAGTFYAYEDSSFTLVGAPDGAYTFTYAGYKNGVSYGTAIGNITIGLIGLFQVSESDLAQPLGQTLTLSIPQAEEQDTAQSLVLLTTEIAQVSESNTAQPLAGPTTGNSVRVSTTSLIAGACVVGDRGLGVLGSEVPSTGIHGAGYLYNDISFPGEASDEFRGVILTVPSSGTFYAYEDSSFTLSGAANGVYTFSYEGFKSGVSYGTATGNITIGSATISLAQVSDSNLAQTLTAQLVRTIDQASDSDLAQALTAQLTNVTGQASDTDLAQALTAHVSGTLEQALEADTALEMILGGAISQVSETNEALASQALLTQSIEIVFDTNFAQALTAQYTGAIGQSLESDLAQDLAYTSPVIILSVGEADSAPAFVLQIDDDDDGRGPPPSSDEWNDETTHDVRDDDEAIVAMILATALVLTLRT